MRMPDQNHVITVLDFLPRDTTGAARLDASNALDAQIARWQSEIDGYPALLATYAQPGMEAHSPTVLKKRIVELQHNRLPPLIALRLAYGQTP
jgi:hypothetical protein